MEKKAKPQLLRPINLNQFMRPNYEIGSIIQYLVKAYKYLHIFAMHLDL